jgi:hypothetical protein
VKDFPCGAVRALLDDPMEVEAGEWLAAAAMLGYLRPLAERTVCGGMGVAEAAGTRASEGASGLIGRGLFSSSGVEKRKGGGEGEEFLRVGALGAIACHLYAHTFAELYLDEEHFRGVVSHWHQRRTHQYARGTR